MGEGAVEKTSAPKKRKGKKKKKSKADEALLPKVPKKWDFVMSFPREPHVRQHGSLRASMVARMRAAGLEVSKVRSRDGDEIFLRITAPSWRLEEEAERMGYLLRLKERHGGGYAEFNKDDRDLFEGANFQEDRFVFRALERQQLIMHILESKKKAHGAEIKLAQLRKAKVIHSFFPLHNKPMKKLLTKRWPKQWKALTMQPLDTIREYFGEKIALYFAWLAHYTQWLAVPAIIGFLLFLGQVSTGEFDNPLVPVFCFFMALWSTFYLEYWKRTQASLALRWGTTGFENEETQRPEFEGEERASPVTGKPEIFWPQSARAVRQAMSFVVVCLMIIVVVFAVVCIFSLRIALVDSMGSSGKVLAGILNFVQIVVLNGVYNKVALYLNNFENYETDTAFEDNLIAKVFGFQFCNNFLSLFYVAYFKKNATLLGGVEDGCEPDCMTELLSQLGTLFVTRMTVGNFMEVGMPWLKKTFLLKKEDRSMKKRGLEVQQQLVITKKGKAKKKRQINPIDKQNKLNKYESTFDDYNEMVVQFGFVTLFVAAFPLAPFLALLNNLVEIRTDALKLCTELQRPVAQRAEDIGTWYWILEIMSTASVVTNVLIITFTSDQLKDDFDITDRLWIFIAVEHLLIIIKLVLSAAIPDIPEEVGVEVARQEYLADLALSGEADDAAAVVDRLEKDWEHLYADFDAGESDFSDNYEEDAEVAAPVSKTLAKEVAVEGVNDDKVD